MSDGSTTRTPPLTVDQIRRLATLEPAVRDLIEAVEASRDALPYEMDQRVGVALRGVYAAMGDG